MIAASVKDTLRDHRGVAFLCLTIFVTSVGMGMISPVLPLFVDEEYHVSRTEIGLAVGLFGIARLFSSLPAGFLAQRYGQRFTLKLGMAINLVGATMVALSFSFPWLIAWRFISGLGASLYTLGVSVYLRDAATPETRARFFSLHEMSILVGQSVGPITGGYIGEFLGLRTPLILQAVFILAALLVLFLLVPETAPRAGVAAPEGQRRELPAAGVGRRGTLRRLLFSPAFIFMGLFSLMIVANRQGGRFSVMPLYGETKGFHADQIGTFISVTHVPQFFTTMASGFLSDRFGRKFPIIPATVLIIAGITLFILGDTFLTLLLSGMLLGLGEGLAGPPTVTVFADIAPPGLEGVTMGLYRTFGGVGSVVGALVLGGIADIGGFAWSLWVDAALLGVAGVGVMLLVRETARRTNREERKAPGPPGG